MSTAEILDELPRLSDDERETILHRLIQLDAGAELEETPEMLAAIDAGIQSLESGSGVSIDEARQRISGWFTK
jgi:predicted transcriptional regulator